MALEMDGAVVQQILSTQTQMLQQMQTMQLQQTVQNNTVSGQAAPIGGAMPSIGTAAAPVGGGFRAEVLDSAAVASLAPPTQYANFASPYLGANFYTPPVDVGQSHTMQRQDPGAGRGLAGQIFNNYLNYNPIRSSKESQADFLAGQGRTLRDGAIDAVGAGVNGAATMGSFFIPGGFLASTVIGVGAGIAVAGATRYMAGEGRLAGNYEDTLRRGAYTFLNPFESTSELGGIGFSRQENQDVAKFLRHIGPEKFLGDQDIGQILTGAMDNKLLKTVTDVESFKKKFSGLVDAVKQITVTMDQSIDEAMKFMGEMDRLGINTNSMTSFSAQAKVTAAMNGISASQGAQQMLQTTSGIVQGTGFNAATVLDTTGNNMFLSGLNYDRAKDTDPMMAQFIQNNGGSAAMGAQTEQTLRGYISQNSSSMFLGLFGSAFEKGKNGEFTLNDSALNSILTGPADTSALMARSQALRNGLSPADQFSLQAQAETLFQNAADPTTQYRLVDFMKRSLQQKNPMDDITAIQNIPGLSLSREQAKFLNDQMGMALDPQVARIVGGVQLQEQLDSIAIAENPSVVQRIKFGVSAMGKDTLGDWGQNIGDGFDDGMYNLSRWTTNISERKRTGGGVYDLSAAGFRKEFNPDAYARINKNLDEFQRLHNQWSGSSDQVALYDDNMFTNPTDYSKGKIDLNSLDVNSPVKAGPMTAGQWNAMRDMVDAGGLGAADLARLQDRLNAPDTSRIERERIQYLINKADGSYDGFWGGLKKWGDYSDIKNNDDAQSVVDPIKKAANDFLDWAGITSNSEVSESTMNDWKDEVQSKYKDLQKNVTSLFTGKDRDRLGVSSDGLTELEGYIKNGAVEKVRTMTNGNTEAVRLAGEYNTLIGKDMDAAGVTQKMLHGKQFTEASARSLKSVRDLLVASGAATEGYADSITSSSTDLANNVIDKLGSDNYTVGQMIEANKAMESATASDINALGEKGQTNLANFLVSQSKGQLKLEDMFQAGSSSLDLAKLSEQTLVQLGYNQSDPTVLIKNEKDGTTASSEADVEMKKTADGHAQAMYDMVRSFQDEMRMMRQQIAGLTVTPPSSSSSVSTKP